MAIPILLTTLNATYQHCAFGLRYLFANLRELQEQARIVEFTRDQAPQDIVERLLDLEPSMVGFGVYIWNVREIHDVVSCLKRVRPEILVVLGGPEVSYETESQSLCQLADVTVRGEADGLFYELCRTFLEEGTRPAQKWISGPLPDLKRLASPYPFYTDEDIRHRVIYVEASRGCPYKCEFCLSSLDQTVRSFDLDAFLAEMDQLIQRGARQFKFVDRTFNLSVATSTRIMSFFLERISLGLFLHFEMVPDRLPPELRELITRFPEGSLQFEVGIQTWSHEVAKLVSRRQDLGKIRENFAFLAGTGVHLHADLIVGLPGETFESFAAGFDAVSDLRSHEIQVGMLKRLKGTPIVRHDATWEMVYEEQPPFQILQTRTMDFHTIQRLARFSKFWDLYANRGNFPNLMTLFRRLAETREPPSLFAEFFAFSEFLSRRHPQRHSLALLSLLESAWIYLTEQRSVGADQARQVLTQDYTGYVKRDVPRFLRDEIPPLPRKKTPREVGAIPRRQSRHLNAETLA